MTGSAPQTSSPAPKAPARTFSVSDGAAARIKLLLDEREKSLPADVPLQKRGFGVMDEDGA